MNCSGEEMQEAATGVLAVRGSYFPMDNEQSRSKSSAWKELYEDITREPEVNWHFLEKTCHTMFLLFFKIEFPSLTKDLDVLLLISAANGSSSFLIHVTDKNSYRV